MNFYKNIDHQAAHIDDCLRLVFGEGYVNLFNNIMYYDIFETEIIFVKWFNHSKTFTLEYKSVQVRSCGVRFVNEDIVLSTEEIIEHYENDKFLQLGTIVDCKVLSFLMENFDFVELTNLFKIR